MSSWTSWAAARLSDIEAAGRLRRVRDLDARGPRGLLEGRPVTSFAGNDYLGLSDHPGVLAAARDALERWGAGATAARLIVGSRPIHTELEAELAAWKGTEAALLFPSGYMANLGVLSALGGPGITVLSDELNHASIVDGCRLARARVEVYAHLDLGDLEARLQRAGRAIVVTDTVFSMDGDAAPVNELIELCGAHDALLVLDEAHAVLGPHPRATPPWVLRVGTLSKFLGSAGGFVAGARSLIDLLVNTCRPFIFTTASAPAQAAAALAALRVLRSPEGARRVQTLRAHVDLLRPGHPSPIVPVILGDERAALTAAAELADRGLLVPAIRPPSVPPGTSRLRVTLSAAHTRAEVEVLKDALAEVGGVHA